LSKAVTREEKLKLLEDSDRAFRASLPFYCRELVKVQQKDGKLKPLILNPAQLKLHEILERQRQTHGWVRAIILKARQMGISTYIGARFYNHATLWLGRNVFILTHEDKATQQLFGMVKRIHEHMDPTFRPETEAANANELKFSGYDGGYRVGTAKNVGGTGRSFTLQRLHGSEVAFWSQAETHLANLSQTVPGEPDTEIILESTANGVGGAFYDTWQQAEAGENDYLPIFLPWTLDPTYRRAAPEGWLPTGEWAEYVRVNRLDVERAYWAFRKNSEIPGAQSDKIHPLFRQEYPISAVEAFQATGREGVIPNEAVLRARRITLPDSTLAPCIIGVDIARTGEDTEDGSRGDSTRIVDRRGRRMGHRFNIEIRTDDLMVIADRVAMLLRENPDIARAFIDVTGLGAGVYDRLRNSGFAARVTGVNFGSAATEPERFANKRAEMHWRMREWFLDPAGADIINDDLAHRHLIATGYKYRDVGGSGLILEPKESIKKRLKFSPDWADAGALTFAETVAIEAPPEEYPGQRDGYKWSGRDRGYDDMDWRTR